MVRSFPSTLRRHILTFVGGLVLLSLLSSTLSLYRITEVNRLLDTVNRVSVPMGRLFAQMQADAEILSRELERGLGYSHWKDGHWQPRPIPQWIQEVLQGEVSRGSALARIEGQGADPELKARWKDWAAGIDHQFTSLKGEADLLYRALAQHDEAKAEEIYPRWVAAMEDWRRQLQWGVSESDHEMRETFALAQTRVEELRTGLEMILGVVVLLSLLMLWLGERAIRPLGELTQLARSITRRGLRREDKSRFPEIPLSRDDEVSQLAREFHRMATALLEREKTVETQKDRLQDQNRLLHEMGALNESVLESIDSILLVTDLQGRITQCNPVALRWLNTGLGGERANSPVNGTLIGAWAKLRPLILKRPSLVSDRAKIPPVAIDGRFYGGHWLPLKQEGATTGSILVLDDLTEELGLQERLQVAENMAAMGRMSAQVAHEVRNPLHSIGLEAELAVELAAPLGDPALKQSLQSILWGVDRLEKITENYLRLSKLSSGERERVDLGSVLESVLATYASVCEAKGVHVDWRREKNSVLAVSGETGLLEQVLGNLMSNSLQALEGAPQGGPQSGKSARIVWNLGNTETGKVWVRIQDNGPGVPPEILPRLFTPFVTSKAQGTGLGLSFVKKVIEEQGGSVEHIQDEHARGDAGAGGTGACFEIILPAFEALRQNEPEKDSELNA